MAFRSFLLKSHRKSKSIEGLHSTKLLGVTVPGQDNMNDNSDTSFHKSRSSDALCTPPRGKKGRAKKDKKKSSSKQDSPLELSVEWKHVSTDKRLVGQTSPFKRPLRQTMSHDPQATRKVRVSQSPEVSDSDHGGSREVTPVRQNDEYDGPVCYRERRGTVLHQLHRSCSLDLLSDEHTFDNNQGAKDLESIVQSKDRSYQRFVSHQERSIQRKRESAVQSFHGSRDRSRLVPDASPILHRRGGRKVAQCMSHRLVQQSRNVEDLLELLEAKIDVNVLDDVTGDALIHIIMKKKKHELRLDFLLALLINSNVDVNLRNKKGVAALHMAVEEGDEICTKALVVFGAEVNMEGRNHFTPLDLAIHHGNVPGIEDLLINVQAKGSAQLIQRSESQVMGHHLHIKLQRKPRPVVSSRTTTNDRLLDFVNRKSMLKLCRELEANVNQRLSFSASIGGDEENTILIMQQREIALFNKTLRKSSLYSAAIEIEEGSRVLCLDGGGIKGLIQIEVLMQIEARMKRKITELFDWIVGTSTGGIIALTLVYGGKSLSELRQLYFKMKDEIFAKGRYGYGWDSIAYEEILQKYLDPKMKLTDVKHPRVLIAAVNKATTNLELTFFNNCLDDEYCNYPVWKVARYTSAAPMFLRECDNYVDGGVICNNPSDCGLTIIQNYYRKQDRKPPIAMVVSIGSGRFPAEKIGKVDAQAFLYFGKQWLQVNKLMKRTQNLLTLLSQALVETEKVAENSESRCKELDIPYYRFNPKLNDIIPAGETDNVKLMDMVIETKVQIKEQKLKEMIEMLQMITATSSDVSSKPAAIPASPKEDSSPSPPGKSQEVDRKTSWQLPQFKITTEEDPEEKEIEDAREGDQSQLNDHYNEMLNESFVHPAETGMNIDTTSADTFMESDQDKNEPSNLEPAHNHYQLEVDEEEGSPCQQETRESYLLETAT